MKFLTKTGAADVNETLTSLVLCYLRSSFFLALFSSMCDFDNVSKFLTTTKPKLLEKDLEKLSESPTLAYE